jgi:hypothetical protein
MESPAFWEEKSPAEKVPLEKCHKEFSIVFIDIEKRRLGK